MTIESRRRAQKEYRAQKRAIGQCWDCLSPALPGRPVCETHHRHRAVAGRIKRERRGQKVRQGICPGCGATALDGECPFCHAPEPQAVFFEELG